MRSPVERFKSLWLGCLLLALISGPAFGRVSGEITGVKLYPDNKRIVIDAKGRVGTYQARVIGKPNRLVMDFNQTRLGNVSRKISVGKADIYEIRVGETGSRARVVVDFRGRPVPAFKVKREKNRITLVLGNSLAGHLPIAQSHVVGRDSKRGDKPSSLTPKFIPATAKGSSVTPPVPRTFKRIGGSTVSPNEQSGRRVASPAPSSKLQASRRSVHGFSGNSQPKKPALKEVKLAQRMDVGRSSTSSTSSQGGRQVSRTTRLSRAAAINIPGSTGSRAPRRMVREVRPPVTPPTPDPRLLVQVITELRFFQVGHNSRLMIRGGDQLDYRMNKVSPTKLRLDLINAEIPKAHQKPLRTDLFSTSVEMIVPGSQTIFIQLKDSVPYQVEKKKGVLMIDFPPPRFKTATSGDQEGGGEASRIIQEEQIRKNIQSRNRDIERIQKGLEQLQKQRLEILKSFQVTPDPDIFQKPVTMDFHGIELKNAFRLLAEQAGVNIIVGSGVTGKTTLRLFEVPLGQVIDTILNTHGLDRVMVGNVMRIGSKSVITEFKNEKQKEYMQRIERVDKGISKSREDIASLQQQIETQLQDLKSLQEVPVDDTKAEEIGEAGCIQYEDERICFQYATVKVVYATPSNIVRTLDCLFRLNCAGARGAAGVNTTVTSQEMADLQSTQAQGRLGRAQYQQYLESQGFSQESPGARARMQRFDQVQSSRERAAASAATAAGISQQGAGVQVQLPYGEDPKLARILAYGIIWANNQDRMIFIKDTPERIAQMKKLIFSLDVPTPQVLIESRLVVANKTFGRGLGILWGVTQNQNGPLSNNRTAYWGMSGASAQTARTVQGVTTPSPQIDPELAISLPTSLPNFDTALGQGIGAAMQFGFLAGNYLSELDARLQIGESTGQSKTISRPKVQVADGVSATIASGQKIPYSTISAEGTQTQLISAELQLNVQPRIFADSRISMQINITDDAPASTAASPVINTRRMITTLTVKDGETAVLGGIIQDIGGDARQGFPILMNVPLIGYLFGNNTKNKSLNELLVFITPSIIRRPPSAS
jgi:type IV pilus secretin PilQ/predicted competence protein